MLAGALGAAGFSRVREEPSAPVDTSKSALSQHAPSLALHVSARRAG
jgi:hypothetical protein